MHYRLCLISLLSLAFCCLPACLTAQTFSIRRSVPFERGDRWRTDITSIKTSTGTATIPGKEKRVNEKETTRLSAIITIDQVDEDGYALVWVAKVARFVGPFQGSSSKTLLRPGTEVIFDRIGDELLVALENGASLDPQATSIKALLMLPTRADDAPFEPQTEMKVGTNWSADVDSLWKTILANGPPQLREHPEVATVKASGQLLAAKQHRDQDCIDVSLKQSTKLNKELEYERQFVLKADQEVEERILIPADYSTGFLDKRTVTKDVIHTESKGLEPSLNIVQATTKTEKRVYLTFEGGGVRPWKAPVRRVGLLKDLLVGLDLDQTSASGTDRGDWRVQSVGALAKALPAQLSGHSPGKVGEATRFDGKDDHVRVEGGKKLLTSGVEAITMACWVKAPPKKVQFVFDVGFYGTKSLSLVAADTTGKFHLGPKTGGISLDFPLVMKDWTHIAVTWDGKLQRVFFNGKILSERKTTMRGRLDAESIDIKLPMLIGAQSKGDRRDERFFAGLMDEFALWTRALEEKEIAAVFEKGEAGETIFDE